MPSGALLLGAFAAWSGAAHGASPTTPTTVGPLADHPAAAPTDARTRIELIDATRPGCSPGLDSWKPDAVGAQCLGDSATRGIRFSTSHDVGAGTLDTTVTVARSTMGAFTADQLIAANGSRGGASSLIAVGTVASLLDDRVRLTSELAWSERRSAWVLAGEERRPGETERGTSVSAKLDARLVDTPRLRWTLTGEVKSVSGAFGVGHDQALMRHFAMPGTRLALSTTAKLGETRLSGGLERYRTSFGQSSARKLGIDHGGISLRLASRTTSARPPEESTLLASRTESLNAFLDLNFDMLSSGLLASVGDLGGLMPTSVMLNLRSAETESHYAASVQRYRRLGWNVDATWDSRLGETTLGYSQARKTALTPDVADRSDQFVQLSHMVRWNNWRFGVDAMLATSSADGQRGSSDKRLSTGQSIAYSSPDGPEFRLALSQDRGAMRLNDDSYLSSDRASLVTATLDLTRYLRKHFERPDLHLAMEYRRALDMTDSEVSLFDQVIDRWRDGFDRQGFLLSFGMKL